jgi:hypothetical protein
LISPHFIEPRSTQPCALGVAPLGNTWLIIREFAASDPGLV